MNHLVCQMHFSVFPFNRYLNFQLSVNFEKIKQRNGDVSMTSPKNSSHVDHEFVVSARNWTRGQALLARGGQEEQGEAAGWTIWSPELRRRPCPRRSISVDHGGDEPQRAEEGKGDGELRRLTRELMPWTAKRGEDGRRRIGARRRPADADRARTLPAKCGHPLPDS